MAPQQQYGQAPPPQQQYQPYAQQQQYSPQEQYPVQQDPYGAQGQAGYGSYGQEYAQGGGYSGYGQEPEVNGTQV